MFKTTGHPKPNKAYTEPRGPSHDRDDCCAPMKAGARGKGPPQSPGAGYSPLSKGTMRGKTPPTKPAR